MIIDNTNVLTSPVRKIDVRVEYLEDSTLTTTFTNSDRVKSLTIDRVGEDSKFFGFGISQKLNIKLVDLNREITPTTAHAFKVFFSGGGNYTGSFPLFHITETNRDENTNELSITAWDKITTAAHTTAELTLTAPYTVLQFAEACANLIGATGVEIIGLGDAETCFDTSYDTGANFEGTETIREALNAVAEVTQTIYYLDVNDVLVFKRLDIDGDASLTIGKDNYITMLSSDNRRLSGITHATELGDNIAASLEVSGTVQIVRNNPFWDLRDDITTLVDNALVAVGGMTINQFDCSWRGNYCLEIGDKINLITKDNDLVSSYIINDVITYNGAFSESTGWKYENSENETESNPTTLGDSLKLTYARVDKANKEIELAVKDIADTKESISSIELDIESVTLAAQATERAIEDANGNIANLASRVEQTVTPTEVNIAISTYLEEVGVNAVETATGYIFDKDGLKISKSGKEMETQITEDGMTVYRNGEAVLVANNEGVNAEDLHATTYLIIGKNSRFEDYGSRTGCFWIGG